MTGVIEIHKRKIWIYAAAVLSVAGLAVWIAVLYTGRSSLENAWEKEFLIRYSAVLNDMASDLGHFEEADSDEEQLSCLWAVTNDLMQLKAFMEVHVNLMAVTMPEKMTAGADPPGWREAERVAGYISRGGTEKSEPLGAEGAVSEETAAVIRLLREETEQLYGDMRAPEEGRADSEGAEGARPDYRYVLSSAEVYQRLTEMLQRVRRQIE